MSESRIATRKKPRMLLVAPSGERAARWSRPLEKAGYRVDVCSPDRLWEECGSESDAAALEKGKSRKKPDKPESDWAVPIRLLSGIKDHRLSISSVLKACSELSPGIHSVALVFFSPEHSACTRMEAQGGMAQAFPQTLKWSRYPLLRAAWEKQVAIYVADSSLLPKSSFLEGRKKNASLILPLLIPQPIGALCVSLDREEAPDPHIHSILLSLTRALEALFENALLYGRLDASETRYRSILSAAPFLIALLSEEGRIIELNPPFLRELRRQGISTRQISEINVLQTLSLPEELRELLKESLQKEEAISREKLAISLPRGTEVFRLHVVPMKSSEEASRELLVIGEIITRYQQFLDEAERTERLAAIGRVAASLAHEINNPLQALRSHLELIRSYPLSDEEREQSFRILEREVERLDETTRRMLGFARPAPEVLQPVSILAVLEQALALSRNYLHNQQIEIATDFPEELPPVLAAAGQLIQVFLNIILNASHAMKGKGRLEIRVQSLGDQVELAFFNEGPPIPAEHLAHIFEPFFTTRPEGTGLGLSISHAILQRHHGTINVANLPQRKGVVFTITLPFTKKIPPVG